MITISSDWAIFICSSLFLLGAFFALLLAGMCRVSAEAEEASGRLAAFEPPPSGRPTLVIIPRSVTWRDQ